MQPGNQDEDAGSFIEAARREQIVAAAIATIAAEGFARASFVRIAKRASISPGLITYHFRTKDALITAVLDRIGARLDAAMEGGPEPVTGYADALRRIVTGHVLHCAHYPEDMEARREIITTATSPAVRRRISEGGESGRAELVEFLAEGQREGEFRAFDPDVFAGALLAAMQAVPRELRRRPADAGADYARELADLFEAAATGRAPVTPPDEKEEQEEQD
ncbi:TetR/AcrR family transcriptional regulator [Allostreptomyces psammosilenae]|uniref:AcrR family transcriptional regulator n=1 Tax=Allostreptomyces psammosilenae TaxID=1892865 RepID=A0A852ZSY1_9ACTN|nr:TetR/AcrR family transcriptional regulator [Allostreptomyces psammosilenae]NYI05536.1 AcrR family transcriptional regulator [Allostreptomyces psammosilenae]